MTKKCNNCQHTWTVNIYACPRCGSTDMAYVNESEMLPLGYKPIEYKTIGPELSSWYKATKEAIKKLPK